MFALVVAFGLWHHEMWRDETQAWLLARDAGSLSELLRLLRYEGHPPAWYLLLYPLARLSGDPATLQVLHLILATATAWLVLRFAPYPRWQRALVVGSYFLAYEYAVLSRSYVLGALALFATCALLPVRRRSYLPLAAPLALLASTSAYGVLVAFGMSAALAADAFAPGRSPAPPRGRHLWVAGAIVFLAACASVLQILPPRDALFVGGAAEATSRASLEWAAGRATSIVWSAYVPMPASAAYPWDRRLLLTGSTEGLAAAMAISVILFAVFALSFARKPAALAAYVIGTGALVLFAWRVHVGDPRHHGHVFLVLLAALWLWHATSGWRLPSVLHGPVSRAERARPYLLAGVLFAQLAAAGWLYLADARRPFSTAEESADAATALGLDRFVPVTESTRGIGISASLGRPIYVPHVRRWATYTDHRLDYEPMRSDAEPLERARAVLGDKEGVLLFSTRESYGAIPGWELERVRSPGPAVSEWERFSVWIARPSAR